MGRATHKFSAASIEINSRLHVDRLKWLSDEVAAATVPTGIKKGAKARIRPNGRGTATLKNYKVGTETKSMLLFSVSFEDGHGETLVTSHIDSFRTLQDKFLLFIPAGPKEMLGWNWYQNFMRNLERAVRAEDPYAKIEIFER